MYDDQLNENEFDPSLPLVDARHEMFAFYLSQGMSQVKAYGAAGYVPTGSNANVLANKPHIQARVAYLVSQNQESHVEAQMRMGAIIIDIDKANEHAKQLTPEWFLFELAVTMKKAREDGKFGDALKALEMGANWLGFFRDPSAKTKKGGDGDGVAAIEEDVGPRARIANGREEALSDFARLFEGDGDEAAPPVEDGSSDASADEAAGTGEALEEHEPGGLAAGGARRSRADRRRVSR